MMAFCWLGSAGADITHGDDDHPVEPFTFVERSFTGYIVAFLPNGRAEPETSTVTMSARLATIKWKVGARFDVVDGKHVFTQFGAERIRDNLDRLKSVFKRYEGLYKFLKFVLLPLYFDGSEKWFVNEHINANGCFLNLGSGPNASQLKPRAVYTDNRSIRNRSRVIDYEWIDHE